MKKKIAFISVSCVLFLCFVCVMFRVINKPSINEDYYYRINRTIKDYDFYRAEVSDGTIILYDKSGTVTQQLPFDDNRRNAPLVYIRKDGACLYFILSGAVDDETGVIFVNDDSNQILDGINVLRRIGGNSYYYDTAK